MLGSILILLTLSRDERDDYVHPKWHDNQLALMVGSDLPTIIEPPALFRDLSTKRGVLPIRSIRQTRTDTLSNAPQVIL